MNGALQRERKKAEGQPEKRPAQHYDFLLALLSAIALVVALGQEYHQERKPSAQCASPASSFATNRNMSAKPSNSDYRSPTLPRKVAATVMVDINRDNAKNLQKLPGVGPVLARRIVDYRAVHGAFTEPADLLQVQGIGPKKFSTIAPLIVAGSSNDGG